MYIYIYSILFYRYDDCLSAPVSSKVNRPTNPPSEMFGSSAVNLRRATWQRSPWLMLRRTSNMIGEIVPKSGAPTWEGVAGTQWSPSFQGVEKTQKMGIVWGKLNQLNPLNPCYILVTLLRNFLRISCSQSIKWSVANPKNTNVYQDAVCSSSTCSCNTAPFLDVTFIESTSEQEADTWLGVTSNPQ